MKFHKRLFSILLTLVMVLPVGTFTAYAAGEYSAEFVTEDSTSDFDLGTAHLGYDPLAFQMKAKVKNTGINNWNYDENSISISGVNADSFMYGWYLTTVGGTVTPENSTSSIYVRPVSGLGAGTYNAILTFKDTDGNVTKTANISFVVSDAPEEYSINTLISGEGKGAVSVNPKKGTTGTMVTLEATPKPGSKFKKWIIEYGKGATLSSETSATTTLTIGTTYVRVNAVFDIDDSVYVVSFYENGGTGTMDSVAVPKNSEYILPVCSFTAPSDKIFDYWSLPGGIKLSAGDNYTINSDITLTAWWKSIYTITFDSNGGSGTMPEIKVIPGSDFELPVNSFEAPYGKEFYKWEIPSYGEFSPGTYFQPSSNLTVKAIWKDASATTRTVTFKDGDSVLSTVTVNSGEKVAKPADPTKSGYTFAGWYADATLSAAFDFNTPITANVTVYAKWTEDGGGGGGEHTHSYSSDWKSDSINHWHECSCGAKAEEAAHTASGWITDTAATATTDGTKHKECTECGYVMETGTIPATGGGEHTHSYSSDWKSDSINHWHECSCGDKDDVAAHSFKWVVDKEATATKKGSKHEECKFCGYQRPAVEIPATGSTTKPTNPTESNPNTGALDDVPKTGDNSNMILWIVLLLASGLGVTGTVVYSKRKKYAK